MKVNTHKIFIIIISLICSQGLLQQAVWVVLFTLTFIFSSEVKDNQGELLQTFSLVLTGN